MNLLTDGIELKAVIPTDGYKKIVIDNNLQSYKIYKIRLDMLYYNDQNDRIATWISQYKMDNSISEFDISDKEQYNNTVHNFITESNKELLNRTQKNINLVGQREAGVVLADGRIIDGNRRFTCLKNIQNESGNTQYFEACILEHNIKNNAKQIKMLELNLQHGIDEKVDYNPIDKLVGVYNDIIESKLLTVKEYANSVGQSVSVIEKEVEKAKLMAEFLEFINAPKKFYLMRNLNLTDLLKELQLMLKKVNDEDKKEDLKNAVFAQVLVQPLGDTRKYVRDIKKIVSNQTLLDNFLDEQQDTLEKVCDKLETMPDVTDKEINELKSDEHIKNEFLHITEKYVEKVHNSQRKNEPLRLVNKAFNALEEINVDVFTKLTKEQQQDLSHELDSLEEILSEIRESLNV